MISVEVFFARFGALFIDEHTFLVLAYYPPEWG